MKLESIINLYRNVFNDRENTAISPFSLYASLGPAFMGSTGTTRSELEHFLGFDGFQQSDILSAYESLFSFDSFENAEILPANSLWLSRSFSPKEQFLELCKKSFLTDVYTPINIDAINTWVSDKTAGKISALFDDSLPACEMIIANALYFRADWRKSFDEAKTSEEDFVSFGRTLKVNMMHQQERLAFMENEYFSALSLPYADDGLSMLILLPSMDYTLPELVAKMSASLFNDIVSSLSFQKVKVSLPVFKVFGESRLNESLQKSGVSAAFNPAAADFSGIADGPLFVSLVKQKCLVEVAEKGTEASAATAVVMSRGMFGASEKVFNADRPFLFAVMHKDGTVYFLGSVLVP